jgi:hypothetical protein
MKTEPGSPLRQWLDWQPKEAITEDPPQSEPTKPSKPGSVGFEGSFLADLPKIELARGGSPVDCVAAPERPMSWAEWKAAALNHLFLEQGTSGQPGRITAETILHGERMNRGSQQRGAGVAGR